MSIYLLLVLLALVAFLYSSVGHGGASGYLAVMALAGISAPLMKSSALVMNLAVSLFSFYGFYQAGHFKWKLFWPFALASVPMAFLGGGMSVSEPIYKKILAICILISIVRMLIQPKTTHTDTKELPVWAGLVGGGGIGFLSGLIGIGGGIILSPLMLLFKWATIKQTAAVSALFIFVNSLSGLLGQLQKGNLALPENMIWAIVATVFGGILGSYFGSQKFKVPVLTYLLATGLLIACLKLFFV